MTTIYTTMTTMRLLCTQIRQLLVCIQANISIKMVLNLRMHVYAYDRKIVTSNHIKCLYQVCVALNIRSIAREWNDRETARTRTAGDIIQVLFQEHFSINALAVFDA